MYNSLHAVVYGKGCKFIKYISFPDLLLKSGSASLALFLQGITSNSALRTPRARLHEDCIKPLKVTAWLPGPWQDYTPLHHSCCIALLFHACISPVETGLNKTMTTYECVLCYWIAKLRNKTIYTKDILFFLDDGDLLTRPWCCAAVEWVRKTFTFPVH